MKALRLKPVAVNAAPKAVLNAAGVAAVSPPLILAASSGVLGVILTLIVPPKLVSVLETVICSAARLTPNGVTRPMMTFWQRGTRRRYISESTRLGEQGVGGSQRWRWYGGGERDEVGGIAIAREDTALAACQMADVSTMAGA